MIDPKVKTFSTSVATHTPDMTTFNLSMELRQSPFYPETGRRDLLPLMEFKDCCVSDKESWEVSDSAGAMKKQLRAALLALLCC